MNNKTKEMLGKLYKKVNTESEEVFLKYLIDCCENVLENEKVMSEIELFNPIVMQLIKLRTEVTTRLENIYSTKYGKFANRTHLLARA